MGDRLLPTARAHVGGTESVLEDCHRELARDLVGRHIGLFGRLSIEIEHRRIVLLQMTILVVVKCEMGLVLNLREIF